VEFTRAVQQRGESPVLRALPRGRLIPALSIALLLVMGVALSNFLENGRLRRQLQTIAARQPQSPASNFVQQVQLASPPEEAVSRSRDTSGKDSEIIHLQGQILKSFPFDLLVD
jgi:hypothetical protein